MRYFILSFLLLSACSTHKQCDCTQFVLDAKYTFDNYGNCQVCKPLFQDELHSKLRQEMLKSVR